MLRIAIVNSCHPTYSKQMLEVCRFADISIYCSGADGCRDVVDLCIGVPDVGDDIYVIRSLKNRGSLCSGKICFYVIRDTSIAVAGIDGLTPYQSIQMLKRSIESFPRLKLDLFILVSSYPFKESVCSITTALGRILCVGIDAPDLLAKVCSSIYASKYIALACRASTLCFDTIACFTYIALPRHSGDRVYLLEVDTGSEVVKVELGAMSRSRMRSKAL